MPVRCGCVRMLHALGASHRAWTGTQTVLVDHVPIWSALVCGAGGSCGGYTRMDGSRPFARYQNAKGTTSSFMCHPLLPGPAPGCLPAAAPVSCIALFTLWTPPGEKSRNSFCPLRKIC